MELFTVKFFNVKEFGKTASTLESCREELQDALEGWIILGLRLGHSLPVLNDIDLNSIKEVA